MDKGSFSTDPGLSMSLSRTFAAQNTLNTGTDTDLNNNAELNNIFETLYPNAPQVPEISSNRHLQDLSKPLTQDNFTNTAAMHDDVNNCKAAYADFNTETIAMMQEALTQAIEQTATEMKLPAESVKMAIFSGPSQDSINYNLGSMWEMYSKIDEVPKEQVAEILQQASAMADQAIQQTMETSNAGSKMHSQQQIPKLSNLSPQQTMAFLTTKPEDLIENDNYALDIETAEHEIELIDNNRLAFDSSAYRATNAGAKAILANSTGDMDLVRELTANQVFQAAETTGFLKLSNLTEAPETKAVLEIQEKLQSVAHHMNTHMLKNNIFSMSA